MTDYQKVILIVPIYSGNPTSLYYIFNERGQDYFTHNEGNYENIVKRLFIIGIYGGKEENPDFISCFEKWFEGTKYFNHVLGIERHKYNLQLKDSVLNIEDIRKEINEFVNPTNATEELSAMAVVLCDENILVTKELIYGREVLSLPKGHKEENEALIDTAIRECFEETNIIITKNSFIKELEPFSYEFLTPSNKLIRKKIVPFLFKVNDKRKPLAKEKRIISADWLKMDDFLEKCSYENVKKIIMSI